MTRRLGLLWARAGYRPWARLLHRFNLHHTRQIGPMEDGAIIHRCDWCGASRKDWLPGVTERRMREAAEKSEGGRRLPLLRTEVG